MKDAEDRLRAFVLVAGDEWSAGIVSKDVATTINRSVLVAVLTEVERLRGEVASHATADVLGWHATERDVAELRERKLQTEAERDALKASLTVVREALEPIAYIADPPQQGRVVWFPKSSLIMQCVGAALASLRRPDFALDELNALRAEVQWLRGEQGFMKGVLHRRDELLRKALRLLDGEEGFDETTAAPILATIRAALGDE